MTARARATFPSEADPDGRQLLISLGIFACLAVVVGLASRVPGGPMDLFERGHWLGPASDMLAGKVSYRDTFPVHGFLSDGGLDWLLFSALSPNFQISLAAHFLLGILFQPSLYLVAALSTRRPGLAAAAIPLNLAMATEIVADRPVLPLLGLAAFAWAVGRPERSGRAILAGCLSGLGFLYALEFGTFVLVGEIAALLFLRVTSRGASRKPTLALFFALGLAAVLLPFSLGLAAAGALVPFLQTSFIDLPRHIHAVWGWDFPTPWDLIKAVHAGEPYRVGDLPIGAGIAKRLYLCPLLGGLGVALAVRLRRSTGPHPAALVAVSVSCLCSFRYVIARLHLPVGNALTGPLLLLILVAAREASLRAAPEHRRRLAAALAASGVLVALSMNAVSYTTRLAAEASRYGSRMTNRAGLVPLASPRGGNALVPAHEALEIAALDAWMRRELPPESSILDLTNRPALYFFLDRRNAVRFYQLPLMQPFQPEVILALRSKPPAAVLLQHEKPYDTTDGLPNPAWARQVWSYVEGAYPRRVQVGETLIALPALAGRETR